MRAIGSTSRPIFGDGPVGCTMGAMFCSSQELTLETVLEICNFEQPAGTIVSVGGQTSARQVFSLHRCAIIRCCYPMCYRRFQVQVRIFVQPMPKPFPFDYVNLVWKNPETILSTQSTLHQSKVRTVHTHTLHIFTQCRYVNDNIPSIYDVRGDQNPVRFVPSVGILTY